MILIDQCKEKTDEDLVILVLENSDYYLCLIRRYEEKLSRYIRRISNVSIEETEDILQEVFIKVYENINNFDLSLKFSSWIYRIAHNQVISAYRKDKSRPQVVDADISNDNIINKIFLEIDLPAKIDNDYLRENIERLLTGLDEKYREVLVLKFLEEKDYKEISDILKKPVGTVGTLINRAKKKFKEEIEKQSINIKL